MKGFNSLMKKQLRLHFVAPPVCCSKVQVCAAADIIALCYHETELNPYLLARSSTAPLMSTRGRPAMILYNVSDVDAELTGLRLYNR